MTKDNLLFIGGTNQGKPPTGGVAAKNQIIFKKLCREFEGEVFNLDVSQHKKNILVLIVLLFYHITSYQRIVISVPTPGLKKLAFLNPIFRRKQVTIFIAGGSINQELGCKRLAALLKNACRIYAQTQTLVDNIKAQESGIPVQHLPNFKPQPQIKIPKRSFKKEIYLLYISRVHRDKGVFRSFEVLDRLNQIDPEATYHLDIYGNMDLTPDEHNRFEQKLKNETVTYKELLDLRKKSGYEILADYHFMLFLTNHPGEGFPGVILDAMIAQVPVMASDWNYNKEIMRTDMGILGQIIDLDTDYVSQTADTILHLKENPTDYKRIQKQMETEAKQYDAEEIQLAIC